MTIRSEIGAEKFENILAELQDLFGYNYKEDAIKNPYLIRDLLQRLREQGSACRSLESIVDSITKLHHEKAAKNEQ